MKQFLTLCGLALALSACASLLPSPGEPTKKFTLEVVANQENSPHNFMVSTQPKSRQLIIELPALYPPIDNTRIAVKPQEQTIDYYADVEWADRLSSLIQESLVYSFQNKKILRGVSRPNEGIQGDYALKIEVRKFYVNHSNASQPAVAQVDYMAHLLKLPERQVIASHQFTHTQVVAEQKMDAIIYSLNVAHLEASSALISWVQGYMSKS